MTQAQHQSHSLLLQGGGISFNNAFWLTSEYGIVGQPIYYESISTGGNMVIGTNILSGIFYIPQVIPTHIGLYGGVDSSLSITNEYGLFDEYGWVDYRLTFVEPVPESTTMLLLGTGLVGVAGAARRKKKIQA